MIKLSMSLMLYLAVLFSGSLKADGTYTFYVVDYPPYIIAPNETLPIHGVDVELVKAALRSQNIEIQLKILPWKRILKSMEAGRIAGTLSCSKREARNHYMLYSDPISYVTRAIVSKSAFDANAVRATTDLSRFSVVTIKGWGIQKELVKSGVDHQTVPDLASALRAVKYRDIDVLYMAEYPALYYLNTLNMEHDLKVTKLVDEEALPLHLCISQHFPNAQQLKAAMDSGLRAIKSNGVYDNIVSNYL